MYCVFYLFLFNYLSNNNYLLWIKSGLHYRNLMFYLFPFLVTFFYILALFVFRGAGDFCAEFSGSSYSIFYIRIIYIYIFTKKYISILSVNLAFQVQVLLNLKLDGVVHQMSQLFITIKIFRNSPTSACLLFKSVTGMIVK